VVLINPPWITRDDNVWHGIKGAMPPLSILSIGAVLEKEGFEVHILDVHVEFYTEEQVKEEIKKIDPDFVGLTVMTSTAIASHQIAKICKEVSPECTVVMGGVHPTSISEETLRNKAVDIVVRGDGEYSMLEICQGKDLNEVVGISYVEDGRVLATANRPDIKELGELPMYAYHLVDMKKYYPAIGAYKRFPAINMLMTRGCPGKCIFCNSAETNLRTRPAAQVVDEIIVLRDRYGIKEIQFYDDTFTVMKQNVFEFCRLMIEKKVGVGFSCFARTDCFSEKMAYALKEAGCHQVMFGVESGNQEMLKILRKDIDLDKTLGVVALAKKVGIEVRAAFTFGTPGETKETIQETLDYALKMDPDLAIFNITTPYPGTQLYNWATKNELLTTHDWWDYELGRAIINMPSIAQEDLIAAYQRAFKVFYNRPIMYWRRFKQIRSLRQFKDSVEAFAQIILKAKISNRGESRKDWLKYYREDYFDREFEEKATLPPLPKVLEEFEFAKN
jgi:anaerobic magnesium-protoporphyrin IX monomethyl ester cyclase